MSAVANKPFRLVVLISGEGSNLQAIIDAIAAGTLPVTIAAVISNRADAYGVERARRAKLPVEILPATAYPDRHAYDSALRNIIDRYQPQLIALAGFMRILSDNFVQQYHGRLINIHPSLLPKFKGMRTHQRVLEAGESEHGASVHFVSPELDSGPIILQAAIPITATDTPASLQQRVHNLEHRLYPEAIRRIASGRIQLCADTVYMDNVPLSDEAIRYEIGSDATVLS